MFRLRDGFRVLDSFWVSSGFYIVKSHIFENGQGSRQIILSELIWEMSYPSPKYLRGQWRLIIEELGKPSRECNRVEEDKTAWRRTEVGIAWIGVITKMLVTAWLPAGLQRPPAHSRTGTERNILRWFLQATLQTSSEILFPCTPVPCWCCMSISPRLWVLGLMEREMASHNNVDENSQTKDIQLRCIPYF